MQSTAMTSYGVANEAHVIESINPAILTSTFKDDISHHLPAAVSLSPTSQSSLMAATLASLMNARATSDASLPSQDYPLQLTVRDPSVTLTMQPEQQPLPQHVLTTHSASSASGQSSSIDANNKENFIFMQNRPASSCGKTSRASPFSVSFEDNKPPDLQRSAGKPTANTSAKGSNDTMPSAKKTRNSTNRRRVKFSPSAKPPSTAGKAEGSQPSLAGISTIPLRLPSPPLALISNPHTDVIAHLRRYGFHRDADDFAGAHGITVDFILRAWVLHVAKNGPNGLLDVTSSFMDDHAQAVRQQLHNAQQANANLPRYFYVDREALPKDSADMLPTHIFAIKGRENDQKGYLVPCHGMLYVLQCVSLPALHIAEAQNDSSDETVESDVENDDSMHKFPVIPIDVPRPKDFALLHRFIYTHDATALLGELLPMRFIARYCHQQQDSQNTHVDVMADLKSGVGVPDLRLSLGNLFKSTPSPPKTLTHHAVDALAQLGTSNLCKMAYKIHSAWANGVAIGFTENTYWATLSHAWSLVVAALGTKKCRLIDAESRGLNLGMKL